MIQEALKLAIQLKDTASGYWTENEIPIIEKLIELLAQPEQEPVAWMDIDEKGAASGLRYWHEPENRHEVPLYTTPPQRTEQNFCSRCGKRTADLTVIHTCTPPQENT